MGREKANKFGFAIDRGGTFTDVYVKRPDGSSRALKLLSENSSMYNDAPTEAIRRVLEEEVGLKLSKGTPIPTGKCFCRKNDFLNYITQLVVN